MGREVGDTSYRDPPGVSAIYAAMDKMTEARIANAENMKLGQFIEKLKELMPEGEITLGPWSFMPGSWDSYRGYYCDMALTFGERGSKKIKDFLAETESCLGKVMTGYKGGDYRMDADTILWADNYGESNQVAIIGIDYWTTHDGKNQYATIIVKKIAD